MIWLAEGGGFRSMKVTCIGVGKEGVGEGSWSKAWRVLKVWKNSLCRIWDQTGS